MNSEDTFCYSVKKSVYSSRNIGNLFGDSVGAGLW
jgi:hypothetical protein